MKKLLLFLFVSLFPIILHAQGRDVNWCFGDSAGLYFPSAGANPIPFISSCCSIEPSASISDTNGNLLFYAGNPTCITQNPLANSISVYSATHTVMPNGMGIHGSYGVTQDAIIIPVPGSTTLYYLFTFGFASTLYLTTIDMSLNSGSGGIVSKNILQNTLGLFLTEKLVAVKHGNGTDWWLILLSNSNGFFKYLITPSQIIGPSIQMIGSPVNVYSGPGQMVFSPQGDKLSVAGFRKLLDLYDFDRCSGQLSNWVYLGDSLNTGYWEAGYYGNSFSPNGEVLYASNKDSLWQYSLNEPDIKASRLLIFNTPFDTMFLGQQLLGPNGKIYITNKVGTILSFNNYNMNLSYIEFPDQVGVACGFNFLGQSLGGRKSFEGLPNMPNYNLGAMPSGCLSGLNEDQDGTGFVSVFPNPATGSVSINSLTNIKEIKLHTAQGRLLIAKQVDSRNFTLDLSNIVSGLYILEIITDKGIDFKKLVVQ